MNRKEAEDFVYKSYLKAEKFQDYQDSDSQKRHPELTRELIRSKAGKPCILVTGSKGKGSVANMISLILQTRYKVGLMTSPHIANFCERFQVNGEMISDQAFADFMTELQPEIEVIENKIPQEICISPMGIQTALALKYFNSQETDINVLEGGKGAQFDDVNNAPHEYAVINSIFLEHTRELGETIEKIARDKAHVITGEQKCVYSAPQEESVKQIILERAKELRVPVKLYGKDFYADNISFSRDGMRFDVVVGSRVFKNITIPLLGEHQARNCAMAMAIGLDILHEIDDAKMKEKLASINWPGRMEVLQNNPFVLLDACINGNSCKNVIDVLKQLEIARTNVVIGIPDDKDFIGVARETWPYAEQIILTRSQNAHYVFTKMQIERLAAEGISAVFTEKLADAWECAKVNGMPTVILGTTSVIAEVKTTGVFS